MTSGAIDRACGSPSDGPTARHPSDSAVSFGGVVDSVKTAGLWVVGYDAWTAGLCALIAAGCLLGLGRLLLTLVAPVVDAVVPMNCGSSIDCALQTVNVLL